MSLSSSQPLVSLVTGANKGIGFEIARGLGSKGIIVLLGCRDAERGRIAAESLRKEGVEAHPLGLDVTDRQSAGLAAKQIERDFGRLDILVNNAGIAREKPGQAAEVDLDVVRQVYETNVFGAIATTQAMLPLLRRSEKGRIVNMSSSLASLTRGSTPDNIWSQYVLLAYNSSKTALNGVTVQFANELRGTPVKINSACPGYCATDLNQRRGSRSAAQGAVVAVGLATLPDEGPTGGFFDEGGPVPW